MVLIDLQKVLSTLGLVSSIAKPIPVVGGVAGGLVDTVGGVVGGAAGSSTGALNGLLGGQTGILSASSASSASPGSPASGSPGARPASPFNMAFADNSTDSAASEDDGFDMASATNTTDDQPVAAMDVPSCAVEPYAPAHPVVLEPFAAYDASKALVYRYRQQQSVNLGSWFVQEQWMKPSLFTCAAGNKQAEFDVASGWGSVDNARQVLERHWDEWITEKDFEYLASIGINTVRLPIGYWSLGPLYCQGTVFESVSAAYVNAWPRVVRAINWAEKYGLGVLVDLHGAPGSQNGQGHGGTSDGQQNLFNNPTNIQLTINALTYLTQQLVKVNNVVGIEILNEPSNVDSLPAFYSQVLGVLRRVSPEAAAFPFYIHDGFDMSRFADYISTRPDFVVLDHHQYFVFGDDASRKVPASQLASDLAPGQGSVSQQIIAAASEERRNIVIDEFSCALSEEALSGSPDALADRRKFCTGQMESFTNSTAGWSFWSYKTEGCPGDENWCFTSAVGKSLPATFFSYPKSTVKSLAASAAASEAASNKDGDASFLSFGTAMPAEADYDSSPMTDDWLESIGNSDVEFNRVNEALATTEYDVIPGSTDDEDDASPAAQSSKPKKDEDSEAPASEGEVGSDDEYELSNTDDVDALNRDSDEDDDNFGIKLSGAPQAAFAINSNYANFDNYDTVPSSRMGMEKRSLFTSLPQRAFLYASDLSRHRFVARHERRQHRRQTNERYDEPEAETPAPASGSGNAIGYTPEQAAISKGYADGWRAAKTFAAFGQSRLGFTGQFISDALVAMDNKIVKGDEGHYRTWFMKGLADGEMQVIKMMALESQGPDQGQSSE